MNCDDLERLARSGQLESRLSDPDVVVHLRECGACEALYTTQEHLGSVLLQQAAQVPELDLNALRTELHAAVERDDRGPAAVRSLPTRLRVGIGVSITLATAAIVAGLGLRADWERYPAPVMALALGGFAVLFAVGYRELSRPMFEPEAPQFRLWISVLALALPIGISVIGADSAHGTVDSSRVNPDVDHASATQADAMLLIFRCLVTGMLSAVPTAAWVFLARRNPWLGTRSLVLVAALLGLSGNLALQVHCPSRDWAHLFFGHAGLGLVMLVPLALWGRRAEGEAF